MGTSETGYDAAGSRHPFLLALRRNIGFNLGGQGIPLLVGVVSLPVTVSLLGPQRFGLLSLAWGLVGYFSIFDLGLGRATTKFVAQAVADESVDEVPALIGTSAVIQTVMGTLGAVGLALIIPWLVTDVLRVPPELAAETRKAFWIITAAVPIFLVHSSVRGALEAIHRFGIVNAIRAPVQSAYFLVPLLGAFLGWTLPPILLGIVAAQALGVGVQSVACRRIFLAGSFRYDARLRSRLLGFGAWVTVTSVVAPLLLYVDRFLIGSLVSVEAVGYYTAPYEVVIRLLIIPSSVVTTLFPAFSALGFEGPSGALEHLLRRGARYVLLLLVPVVGFTIVFARPVLGLWLGEEFAVRSTGVLRILAVGILVNGLAQVPFAFIQGMGRPDISAKFHLLELPIYLGLAFLFVNAWGILGAASAWSMRAAVDLLLLSVGGWLLWRHHRKPLPAS